MANDCSLLWHLSDDELLTYFISTYPQLCLWKMLLLWLEMNSVLILSLQQKWSQLELYLPEPAKPSNLARLVLVLLLNQC